MDLDELSRARAHLLGCQKKLSTGIIDDDALAFAILRHRRQDGAERRRERPRIFRSNSQREGFRRRTSCSDDNDEWRFPVADLRQTANTASRSARSGSTGRIWRSTIVSSQLTPWLVALPLMLLLLIVLLSRELKPLKKLAQTLRARAPDVSRCLLIREACQAKCARWSNR